MNGCTAFVRYECIAWPHSRAWVGVHPAVLEAGAHRLHVALADWLHRLERHGLRLIQRVLERALNQWRVDVVVAHLAVLDAKHLAAQTEVAVQRRQALV